MIDPMKLKMKRKYDKLEFKKRTLKVLKATK